MKYNEIKFTDRFMDYGWKFGVLGEFNGKKLVMWTDQLEGPHKVPHTWLADAKRTMWKQFQAEDNKVTT